jgi:hypothetical protein
MVDAMRKTAATQTAACVALALFTAISFRADEARADAAPSPEPTLHGFGRLNADCLEWMNGCAVCRRLPPRLSPARPWSRRGRINIACQPRAIVCLLKKPS